MQRSALHIPERKWNICGKDFGWWRFWPGGRTAKRDDDCSDWLHRVAGMSTSLANEIVSDYRKLLATDN